MRCSCLPDLQGFSWQRHMPPARLPPRNEPASNKKQERGFLMNGKGISRRGEFVLAVQMDCLYDALKIAVNQGLKIGEPTIALLAKLEADMKILVKGPCVENWPPALDPTAEAGDILARAGGIRGVALSFITEDELKET